jgi:1-acyl-sn-glycerol-3-phosphate acyltransferase
MMGKKRNNSIWNYCLTALFAICFVVIIVLIIPIVLFNDLVFGKYRGWNYNYRVFDYAFKLSYFVLGIRTRHIMEQPTDKNKQYVFVANHLSYFDIPEMLAAVKQPVRILGKKGPEKIPLFGYYYKKSVIMVDRESDDSRINSVQRLRHYLSKGISILICPEGTFNMTNAPLKSFYNGAFRLAIETQTNIKPLLLLDTFHTLHYSGIGINNGESRVVHLPEVSVQGLGDSDVEQLKQTVYAQMESALIRYKAGWIG